MGRCFRRSCHPAVAPLPEKVLCDQGCDLTPFADPGSVPQKEASALPIGQEVLMTGTSQVHRTGLEAGYTRCNGELRASSQLSVACVGCADHTGKGSSDTASSECSLSK